MTNPTQTSYDQIPYPTVARFQTHPNHLAVLGKLLGMQPAPVVRCRVLDLGCGDGSNLIPMAYQLPESEFVGLDLSPKQIAAGQELIAGLGLTNITLHTKDIMEVEADVGQFDYIIVYGVYSWVPAAVQNKILDICRQHLTPQGIAYISYNIYPGWHLLGMVREMMVYYTRQVANPYQRAKKAREMLDFLVEMMPTLTRQPSARLKANLMILESVQELYQQQPDEYLLHDPLEAINEPLYLHQFVARTAPHGLRYLTDAESSALLAAYFPAEFSEALQKVAHTELEVEQLMDFLYSRSFRQTLLCHEEVALNQGEVTLEQWTGLQVASPAKPVEGEVDLFSTGLTKFRGPLGTTIATNQPLNKAALLHLAEVWPQPVPFKELLKVARARLNPATAQVYSAADLVREADTLGNMLLKGYAVAAVELYAHRPPFVSQISSAPLVSPLARQQAQQSQHVTNQCHKMITLEDGVSRYLLPYLDGQHDRTALLEVLADLVAQGTLVVQFDGSEGQSPTQLRPILAEVLDQTLDKLKQDALLVG